MVYNLPHPTTGPHSLAFRVAGWILDPKRHTQAGADMSRTQFQRHREAFKELTEIFKEPHKTLFIHYSCESLYDRSDGRSPRITSIAVRSLGSGQTRSFSIHQQAELQGKGTNEITPHYDVFEKEMLTKFYEYVGLFATCKWVHWNMRDANFGFEAIAHRFRVLGGNPVDITDANKVDLARLIYNFLGPDYVEHPRLYNLLKMNDMFSRNLMEGGDEAKAFDDAEYVKLHQSTLSKVDVIMNIAEAAFDDRLKSYNNYFRKRGISLNTMFDIVKVHPLYTAVGVVATVIALIVGVWNLIDLI